MTLAIVLLIVLVFGCYAAARSIAAAIIMKRLMVLASALWLIILGGLAMLGGGIPVGQFLGVTLLPIAAAWLFVLALIWAVAPRGF